MAIRDRKPADSKLEVCHGVVFLWLLLSRLRLASCAIMGAAFTRWGCWPLHRPLPRNDLHNPPRPPYPGHLQYSQWDLSASPAVQDFTWTEPLVGVSATPRARHHTKPLAVG